MLVDQAQALEELGITQEDYLEFLGDLLAYTQEVLPQMKIVIEDQTQQKEMHHLAHALKGACRNLRFIAAGDLASDLERWGEGVFICDASAVFAKLNSVLIESFREVGITFEA